MDKEALLKHLKDKPDLKHLIQEAMDDQSIRSALVELVLTEASSLKFQCSKIIRLVSEEKPELIYPYFEEIIPWLFQKKQFYQMGRDPYPVQPLHRR